MSKDKERLNLASGTPWEPLRGYSRAVKIGDRLHVSGTTAMSPDGEVIGGNDPYEQTRYVIKVLRDVLTAAGFAMTDVVRTRLFVTNIQRWEDYARAHSEVFDSIRPASSIVQVTRLVDPRLLIEMEVDAELGVETVRGIRLS